MPRKAVLKKGNPMRLKNDSGYLPTDKSSPSGQRGMTLIEVMIVVVIVAILAAIAYPSYQDQVRKSRRAEGKALLLEAQARQERFFTEQNSYGDDITDLGYGADPEPSENGWYNVTVSASIPAGCAPGGTACTGFTLQAAPQPPQDDDTKCANLTIDSLGVKGADGTSGAADCW